MQVNLHAAPTFHPALLVDEGKFGNDKIKAIYVAREQLQLLVKIGKYTGEISKLIIHLVYALSVVGSFRRSRF